ncbi:SAM-dependent methyltransferase [Litoreibacter roseus]|uniref:SAM-dependent methyltransferase n=2 Tax=Litoreibacter roseus TaxID=2601869 RepID=A0A6N6JD51_9RHOB|nr:SAM-dependent methyltransferase [Litoreibacter roseus]
MKSQDSAALFTGATHAPAPLSGEEKEHLAKEIELTSDVALDAPPWLEPDLKNSLGTRYAEVMATLQNRAPVFLRVNRKAATLASAQESLANDGVETQPCLTAPFALKVVVGERRVPQSAAWAAGLIEVQDAASQAVCEALPLDADMRVLDYCAGGGGKALAIADIAQVRVFAHDADPGRMSEIPDRAKRAGVKISRLSTAEAVLQAPFDLVLCDVPCSGSGAWRRSPEGKWKLTQDALSDYSDLQYKIFTQAAELVSETGILAYATCSIIGPENTDQIDRFCAEHPEWRILIRKQFLPSPDGDGFFVACLTRGDRPA